MHKPKKAQNGGVGFSFMYNDRSMEFSIYCHGLFRTSGVDNPICQTFIMCFFLIALARLIFDFFE